MDKAEAEFYDYHRAKDNEDIIKKLLDVCSDIDFTEFLIQIERIYHENNEAN